MAIVIPFPTTPCVRLAYETAVEGTSELEQYQQFVESVLALLDQVSRTREAILCYQASKDSPPT